MSGGEGTVFKMAAGNIVCTTTWIKMNGCNVKLPLSGFKLIELTPNCFKVKNIHVNYDFVTLLSLGKYLEFFPTGIY